MLTCSCSDVSIQLVSPASGEGINTAPILCSSFSFHSISFPSEWGGSDGILYGENIFVSIQLVSPASGEAHGITEVMDYPGYDVSIQLVSPASGESGKQFELVVIFNKFPFN